MIKALWFIVKLSLLAALIIWVSQHPGTVNFDWTIYGDRYEVAMPIGVFIAALVLIIMLYMYLDRFINWFRRAPTSLARYSKEKRQDKAYMSITHGLSALAAGDVEMARFHTQRARKAQQKDYGMVTLLEGMTARLEGHDTDAEAAFETMLKKKETAFLGVRGLMQIAMDDGRFDRAIEMAERAHDLYPKQRWIIKTLYKLRLQARDWDGADQTLRKAVRMGCVSKDQAKSDRIAMDVARSHEALSDKLVDEAYNLALRAHKRDRQDLTAALSLLPHYLRLNKRRQAQKLIEKVWAVNPHPDLLQGWTLLAPDVSDGEDRSIAKRVKWFEKLIALNPRSSESYLALADIAIEEKLYGQARSYLDKAAEIRPSKTLYLFLARLERGQNQDELAAREAMEKAADMPESKKWVCTQTGMTYEKWSPFAEPHKSFNTIIWDFPVTSYAPAPNFRSLLSGQDDYEPPFLVDAHQS